MFDAKITAAINYHTHRLSKTFELQEIDEEDIKQELALKVLEIMSDFPEGKASQTTFIKRCLENKAVDLARQYKKVLPTVSIDEILQSEYDNQQPYGPVRPRIVRIEKITWQGWPTQCDHYLDLKLDVAMILKRLSPRQRKICKMLMRDKTQQQIADKLGLSRSRIQQLIYGLRPFFINV